MPTEHKRAKFTEEVNKGYGEEVEVVTKCWCGWSTTAQNQTLYGKPGALDDELLAHRISHIEGAVFDAD